jgi:GT2 family glycosyltransferase
MSTPELRLPAVSPTIALITVLFNCEKHLPLFFESLSRQTERDFLVIVVDNASKDASLACARELAAVHGVPSIFIANDDNLGIAVGNNQGVEQARERGLSHLVLINNDIGCDPDLLARLRQRAIGRAHRAWTCLAWYGDTDTRWYGGGRLSYWLARGIHFDAARSADILQPISVTYAPTCLMYLHASVFDEVGLMDPKYFVYYDDTDFCKRLVNNGIQLIYDPAVSFNHYVGGSSGGELSAFFLRINTRNKFIYIAKHYAGPGKAIVMSLAIASKLIQLVSVKRRAPTWSGLKDAFLGIGWR